MEAGGNTLHLFKELLDGGYALAAREPTTASRSASELSGNSSEGAGEEPAAHPLLATWGACSYTRHTGIVSGSR